MTSKELKDRLSENKDELIKVLESIELHSIKIYQTEIRSALPNRNNPSSVRIKIEGLWVNIFSDDNFFTGDIFDLISFIKDFDFKESIKYIHSILGLKYEYKSEGEKLSALKIFRKNNHKIKNHNTYDHRSYDLTILDQFVHLPHKQFVKDGILPQTQNKYHVCFCPENNRIVIPHFHPKYSDKVVGLVGRTVVSDYKTLLIPKYYNFIKGYQKNSNLYGLSQNSNTIASKDKVIVFESEKSVMQLDSFYNESNSVAICGKYLLPIQRQMLLELDVKEIIFAFDKDVSFDYVFMQTYTMSNFKKISIIIDDENLLREKDSPTDRGVLVFEKLFNNRKVIQGGMI